MCPGLHPVNAVFRPGLKKCICLLHESIWQAAGLPVMLVLSSPASETLIMPLLKPCMSTRPPWLTPRVVTPAWWVGWAVIAPSNSMEHLSTRPCAAPPAVTRNPCSPAGGKQEAAEGGQGSIAEQDRCLGGLCSARPQGNKRPLKDRQMKIGKNRRVGQKPSRSVPAGTYSSPH